MEKRNVIEAERTPKGSKQAEAMDEAVALFVTKKKKEVKDGSETSTRTLHGRMGEAVLSQ